MTAPTPAVYYGPRRYGQNLGDWTRYAACTQLDPLEADRIFFPPTHKGRCTRTDLARARLICNQCPTRTDCLDYALDTSVVDGIWAGTDPEQRRQLRRKQP